MCFFAGGFPYPNVTNQELLSYLLSGQRLERPENCSEHLYDLMLTCWAEMDVNRPEFSEIVKKLEPDTHKMIYVDFNELRHDYVFPPTLDLTQGKVVVATADETNTLTSTATESTTKR